MRSPWNPPPSIALSKLSIPSLGLGTPQMVSLRPICPSNPLVQWENWDTMVCPWYPSEQPCLSCPSHPFVPLMIDLDQEFWQQVLMLFLILPSLNYTKSKKFSLKNKKDLGMACHTPPLKKVKKQGEMPLPSLGPIPSLNSTFFNGMGPRLGNGIFFFWRKFFASCCIKVRYSTGKVSGYLHWQQHGNTWKHQCNRRYLFRKIGSCKWTNILQPIWWWQGRGWSSLYVGSWLIRNLLAPKEPSKKLFEEIIVKVMSKRCHSNHCQSYSAICSTPACIERVSPLQNANLLPLTGPGLRSTV